MGSFDRVANVLVAMSRMDAPRVAQIGAYTGLPASAVYRCLTSLVEAGLVEEGPTRGRYHAGVATVALAERYRHSVLSGDVTSRTLHALAAHTREFAALLVRRGDDIVCIDAADGFRVLRCTFVVGEVVPMVAGASASAILAYLPDDEVEGVLARNSVAGGDAAALRASYAEVRERGFAMSAGEVDEGVWGVAAPVFREGMVIGAVATMAPVIRASRLARAVVPATVLAAKALSEQGLRL
ncbi:IclR family transcriptional regulator [Microbacterium saperdae]|uniref:IclR family transcriptional regulator n=2 Tax=Microbacterium saperdae TaxID=69368 RepID=A0A543BNN0_9MICO|nr:IclR family transcriptional regulator [Microbacterium saperdae]